MKESIKEGEMGTAPAMAKSYFGRLADRYRDAYGVAASLVSLGNTVKRCSFLLAGGVIVISLVSMSLYVLVAALFAAAFIGAVTYAFGRFLAAQGQFMSAMLDTAVNTSPHLQESEKASIMGL
jgi:hypothetical protein